MWWSIAHCLAAAFRFFRTCLRLKNGNIFKHLVKHDVFKPILELTLRESKRDNLLSSSCLEYFDFMRRVRPVNEIKLDMTS